MQQAISSSRRAQEISNPCPTSLKFGAFKSTSQVNLNNFVNTFDSKQENLKRQMNKMHEELEQTLPISLKRDPSMECAAVLSSLGAHISLMGHKGAVSLHQIQSQNAAQSPNSAGSDACSYASSSGASSVSPQPGIVVSSATNEIPHHSSNTSNGIYSHPSSSSLLRSNQSQQNKSPTDLSFSFVSSVSPASSNASSSQQNSRASGLSPPSSSSAGSLAVLNHFPQLMNDGINLTWFHGANSRAKLHEALLSSDKIVIAGDVSLAEMSRYPLPIMAKAPSGVSDITLENWFLEAVRLHPHKAIKLTFTTTRAVEPAFRVLARHADSFKGPLILDANILSNPLASNQNQSNSNNRSSKQQQRQQQPQQAQQQYQASKQQPVDAWTFLMLCRTRFPKSMISIGWCPTETNQSEFESTDMADPCIQSSADSVFELEMMEPPQPSKSNQKLSSTGSATSSTLAPSHQHQQQIGHLQQHLGRTHRLHPYQLAHNHQRHSQLVQPHLSSSRHLLSSSASLNSSSGNSSGSSSPTSPIGHLMAPVNMSLAHKGKNSDGSGEQVIFLGFPESSPGYETSNGAARASHSAAAAAAAAAFAAAVVAATNGSNGAGLETSDYQQLPLNLNVNEADQSIVSNGSPSLNELAHRIQSFNQQRLTNGLQLMASLNGQTQNLGASVSSSSVASPTGRAYQSAQQNSDDKLQQQRQLLLKTNGNEESCYTREMIDKMAAIVKEYSLTQPITFPIEARIVKNSLAELQRLLYQVGGNSSLTVIVQQDDLTSIDDLLVIRKSFAANQILYDLPEELACLFKQELELL